MHTKLYFRQFTLSDVSLNQILERAMKNPNPTGQDYSVVRQLEQFESVSLLRHRQSLSWCCGGQIPALLNASAHPRGLSMRRVSNRFRQRV